ncbi:hypothetical protein FJZ31_40915 [Candidatus Poribacteria bacterium]|nr:hypothetical protein [Candidatus Poribacteria bacterium]
MKTTTEIADYSVASEPWDSRYGNHRIRIRVVYEAEAAWAHIPWRRRDQKPQDKAIIIVDAKTGEEIQNVIAVNINREYGDLVFEPRTAPGEYYVYYLPNETSGWEYMPDVTYARPISKADKKWLTKHVLSSEKLAKEKWKDLPQVEVVDIQAIDEFHRFDPMEVIATEAETQELLVSHQGSAYLLFPEDRAFPIRMSHDLPARWMEKGPSKIFKGEAQRGEFYVFQVGIYACGQAINDIEVEFAELKPKDGGQAIPAEAFRCFNLGGIDEIGQPFEKKFEVERGKIRALWFGVQIPMDAVAGEYESRLKIIPQDAPASELVLCLRVTEQVLEDYGDSELWRHSRLRWLDSTLGLDDEVVAPYTPLKVDGRTIECLGRSVSLGDTGLPRNIQSQFAPAMTYLLDEGREMLAQPINFSVQTKSGRVAWSGSGVDIIKKTPGTVAWESQSKGHESSTGSSFTLQCRAQMEFDGHIEYNLTLSSNKTVSVRDICLEISLPRDVAKYFMGMGYKGGNRPQSLDWKWDVDSKQQDSLWIGDVNASLQLKLKGENYSRPLINIYYRHKPLNLPPSWGNNGRGGCEVREEEDNQVVIRAYSGERLIEAGEKLHFDFTLLLTPFKPIDTVKHFKQRYYHQYGEADKALEAGANIINIHHANETNPYINYPFLRTNEMRNYIKYVHDKGLKAKIYYTVRELSNHVVEMWALRSLGDEIFVKEPGGGYSWLQEHLESDYLRAWYDANWQDAAIITNGASRWNNYYIDGLAWLLKNVEIDGLYIDDMAYGREVMKRVRKVMDRLRPGCLIDFHSWNHFNERAGFVNCANLYLENFPYFDRIWFGEGFDYNESPDYWLIEISGIPYGQMGEMLQGGGNPWRGMIYGMTARMPWAGNPEHIWKVCDEFGIEEADMIGYWTSECPVKTDHKDVFATVYRRPERVLVALASWAKAPVECRLNIDWQVLGLDASKARIIAPVIKDFQEAASFKPSDAIPIEPGRGWLVFIEV